MNYYYLAATLPSLTLDEPPLLSNDQFRELCSEHLTTRDFTAVEALLSGEESGSGHPFVRDWKLRESQLRNAIARARAARLGRDPGPHLRNEVPYGPHAERVVTEAFTKKSPLAREQAIDNFRWQQIEEMGGLDPFKSRAILAYALKFRLSNRWAAMNRENGEEKADALINQKEEQ